MLEGKNCKCPFSRVQSDEITVCYVKDIGSRKSSKLGRHLWMFSQHFTNPMHLSTPCFNTNRFKRQTAFRLVATMIQTATHMVLMWNFVECRSGLKQTFSENVSKKQHGLTKAYFRIPSILFYTEVLLICI